MSAFVYKIILKLEYEDKRLCLRNNRIQFVSPYEENL